MKLKKHTPGQILMLITIAVFFFVMWGIYPSAQAQIIVPPDSMMIDSTWNFFSRGGDTTFGPIGMDSNSIHDVLNAYFELMTTEPSHQEGLLFYDKDNHTFAFYNDESDVTLQVGQEFWIRVQADVAIDNGELVYQTGTNAHIPTIDLAQADAVATSLVIGLATHDIELGTFGYITTNGIIRDLNTDGATEGGQIFLSEITAGMWTETKPGNGDFIVPVGTIANAHISEGSILANINRAVLAEDINQIDSAIQITLKPDETIIHDTLDGATYQTLADWWNTTQSAYIISGGIMSQDVTDSTKLDVTSGTAVLKKTNSDIGENVFLNFSAGVDLAVTDSTDLWSYIDYDGGSPSIKLAAFSTLDFTTKVALGKVYREGNHMHITQGGQNFSNYSHKNTLRLFELYNLQRGFGIVTGAGANVDTNDIDVTAGAYYLGHNRNVITSVASFTDGMVQYWGNGAGSFTKLDTNMLNDVHYDDGDGTRRTLVSNKFNIFWIYMMTDNELVAIYDSVTVSGGYSLAGALGKEVVTTLPGIVASSGVFIAKVIVKQGDGIYSIEYPWTTSFVGATTSDHGALSGLADDDHTQYLKESDTAAFASTILVDPSFTGTLIADSAQFDGNVDIDSLDVNGVAEINGILTMGANLAMGTNDITGVGDATAVNLVATTGIIMNAVQLNDGDSLKGDVIKEGDVKKFWTSDNNAVGYDSTYVIDENNDTVLICINDGAGDITYAIGSNLTSQTFGGPGKTGIDSGDAIIMDVDSLVINSHFVYGAAVISEAELEILDGATITTDQLNKVIDTVAVWDNGAMDSTHFGDATIGWEDIDTTGSAVTDVDTLGTKIAAALADRTNIHDTLSYNFNLADPDGLYTLDHEWCFDKATTDAITIVSYSVSLNADPTDELEYSIKWADALIGFASAAVIDDSATVAGVTTVVAGFGDATVPAGKCLYILFDADPDDDITQAIFKINYTVDK